MRSSFRLGRVAGVTVSANWSVLLIGALITFTTATALFPAAVPHIHPVTAWSLAILGAGAFFASLLAHEVSHAVVARRHGVPTDEITLWLFGGVAKLQSEAPDPRSEMRIAAVGPATSIVLAGVFAGLAALGNALDAHRALVVLAAWLAVINGSLGVFNLLPGLPLDGGRILRAWRWKRTGDPRAGTRAAATGGRVVGAVLIALGLVQISYGGGGLWTALIGWFLWQSATAEGRRVAAEATFEALTVGDVTDVGVPVVDHLITLDRLAHDVMPRSGRSAVVLHDATDQIVGVVDTATMAQKRQSTWGLTPAWQVALAPGVPGGVPFARPEQHLKDVLGDLTTLLRPLPSPAATADGGEIVPPAPRPRGYVVVMDHDRFMGLVTPGRIAAQLMGQPAAPWMRPPVQDAESRVSGRPHDPTDPSELWSRSGRPGVRRSRRTGHHPVAGSPLPPRERGGPSGGYPPPHAPAPRSRSPEGAGWVVPVEVETATGLRVRIRRAHPGDEEALLVGFSHLSDQSRYHRFFTALPRLSGRLLEQLIDIDDHERLALATFDPSRPSEVGGPDGFGIAVARYIQPDPAVPQAELAIAIIDEYQGQGLGDVLLTALEVVARGNGLTSLYAIVLGVNVGMTRLLIRHGARLTPHPEDDVGVRRYTLDLAVEPERHADPQLVEALRALVP
jgi:Zn-dependent protease/GNAT superfamily N-acetyltransferase